MSQNKEKDHNRKQIFQVPLLSFSQKCKNFKQNQPLPCKMSSSNQAFSERDLPNKSNLFERCSKDKRIFLAKDEDSLLASIEREIEKLEEKTGSQSCPACEENFENYIFMTNHFYAFHQSF
jgi:hypothetical protein